MTVAKLNRYEVSMKLRLDDYCYIQQFLIPDWLFKILFSKRISDDNITQNGNDVIHAYLSKQSLKQLLKCPLFYCRIYVCSYMKVQFTVKKKKKNFQIILN